MAKVITDGKLIVTTTDDQIFELVRPFEKIKYSFQTITDRLTDELEIVFSAMEENSSAEYYEFAASIKEASIKNIKFNYLLVDQGTKEAEEFNLFDSNILKNKKILTVEFNGGASYERFNVNSENNLYTSTLMRFVFTFI